MLRFAVVFALALIGSTAVLDRAGFAQEEGFRVPDLQHLGPGVPGELPDNSPGLPDSAYADFVSVQASGTQYKDAVARTRGPQDVSLFREAAPSVVLIKTDKGFGSGSILKVNADLRSNPFILTNFHVIGQNREITVVFRPLNPTGAPSEDEVVKAAVVKIDPRRDLDWFARVPCQTVKSIR
jgi:S1-C subfamily serine protease